MKIKLLTLLIFTLYCDRAQTQKVVNTTDFIFECTKYSGILPKKQMVIWFPNELWTIIRKQLKLSNTNINSINLEMKNYLMFAVVDYDLENGKVKFKSD